MDQELIFLMGNIIFGVAIYIAFKLYSSAP